MTNLLFGHQILDVVVEAEVHHVEDAVSPEGRGQPFVQSPQPKPVFGDYFFGCFDGAALLDKKFQVMISVNFIFFL